MVSIPNCRKHSDKRLQDDSFNSTNAARAAALRDVVTLNEVELNNAELSDEGLSDDGGKVWPEEFVLDEWRTTGAKALSISSKLDSRTLVCESSDSVVRGG